MRIYSIFPSIDGEVNAFHQGRLTTFIRLVGCNLNCRYCDTVYAQPRDSGKDMAIQEVIAEVEKYGNAKVTITGGEPLLQEKELKELCSELGLRYLISIETNGSFPIPNWKLMVGSWIVDYKLVNSGMSSRMDDRTFENLMYHDFVKFVVGGSWTYRQAISVMARLKKFGCLATFAFSPQHGQLHPATLVEWLQCDKVDAIVNLQLHKYIWPNCGQDEER
jgi:7-carboxy-7-deazaguanine synthase